MSDFSPLLPSTSASDPTAQQKALKVTEALNDALVAKHTELHLAWLRPACMSVAVNITATIALALGFVSALVAFFSGASVVVLVIASVRLLIAVGDTICAGVELHHRKHAPAGDSYLPMGGDCIGNLTYAVMRMFGADKVKAEEYAKYAIIGSWFIQMCTAAVVNPLVLSGIALPSYAWYFSYLSPIVGTVAGGADITNWIIYKAKWKVLLAAHGGEIRDTKDAMTQTEPLGIKSQSVEI